MDTSANYCVNHIKFSNYQYMSHGGVSSSSRVARLKYNEVSDMPYISSKPVYTSGYTPPVFRKPHRLQNTHYSGTKEGSRFTMSSACSRQRHNQFIPASGNYGIRYRRRTQVYLPDDDSDSISVVTVDTIDTIDIEPGNGGNNGEPGSGTGLDCSCDTMVIDPNDTTDYSRLHLQLQSLYENAGVNIDTVMKEFIAGNLNIVRETLTRNYYNELSLALYDEKCERFTYYENLRQLISGALQVISQTLVTEDDLRIEITNIQNELDKCKNPASRALFEFEETLSVVAQVRPEYQEYIIRYGYPDGGVFDADLLAEILLDLDIDPPPSDSDDDSNSCRVCVSHGTHSESDSCHDSSDLSSKCSLESICE